MKSRILECEFGSKDNKNTIGKYYDFSSWFLGELKKDKYPEITFKYLKDKEQDFQHWNKNLEREESHIIDQPNKKLNLVNVFLACCSYYKILKLNKNGVSKNFKDFEIKNSVLNGLRTDFTDDESSVLKELLEQIKNDENNEKYVTYTVEELKDISSAYDALFQYAFECKNNKSNERKKLLECERLYYAFENFNRDPKIKLLPKASQIRQLYNKAKNEIKIDKSNYKNWLNIMESIGLYCEKSIQNNQTKDKFIFDVSNLTKDKNGNYNTYKQQDTHLHQLPYTEKEITAFLNNIDKATQLISNDRNNFNKIFKNKKIICPHNPIPSLVEGLIGIQAVNSLGFNANDIWKAQAASAYELSPVKYKSNNYKESLVPLKETGTMYRKDFKTGIEYFAKLNTQFDRDLNIIRPAESNMADTHILIKHPSGKIYEIIIEPSLETNVEKFTEREFLIKHFFESSDILAKSKYSKKISNLSYSCPKGINPKNIKYKIFISVGQLDKIQNKNDIQYIKDDFNERAEFLYKKNNIKGKTFLYQYWNIKDFNTGIEKLINFIETDKLDKILKPQSTIQKTR